MGPAGQPIDVSEWMTLMFASATSTTFQNGVDGGACLNFSEQGWFETNLGGGLQSKTLDAMDSTGLLVVVRRLETARTPGTQT